MGKLEEKQDTDILYVLLLTAGNRPLFGRELSGKPKHLLNKHIDLYLKWNTRTHVILSMLCWSFPMKTCGCVKKRSLIILFESENIQEYIIHLCSSSSKGSKEE